MCGSVLSLSPLVRTSRAAAGVTGSAMTIGRQRLAANADDLRAAVRRAELPIPVAMAAASLFTLVIHVVGGDARAALD
jgi:hypothetical protein